VSQELETLYSTIFIQQNGFTNNQQTTLRVEHFLQHILASTTTIIEKKKERKDVFQEFKTLCSTIFLRQT